MCRERIVEWVVSEACVVYWIKDWGYLLWYIQSLSSIWSCVFHEVCLHQLLAEWHCSQDSLLFLLGSSYWNHGNMLLNTCPQIVISCHIIKQYSALIHAGISCPHIHNCQSFVSLFLSWTCVPPLFHCTFHHFFCIAFGIHPLLPCIRVAQFLDVVSVYFMPTCPYSGPTRVIPINSNNCQAIPEQIVVPQTLAIWHSWVLATCCGGGGIGSTMAAAPPPICTCLATSQVNTRIYKNLLSGWYLDSCPPFPPLASKVSLLQLLWWTIPYSWLVRPSGLNVWICPHSS